MQLDLIDLQAKDWAPAIAACLVDPAEAVQRARRLLESWDYSADVDSAAACLYYPLMDRRWHKDFMHAVLGDDLLLSMPAVAVGLGKWGIADFFQPGAPWLAHREKLEAMLSQQVTALVASLDQTLGGSDWRWGKLQHVEFKHSLGEHAPWQAMRVGPDPIGGSATTLRMAMRLRVDQDSEQLRVYHGPAFRWVVDLADPLHFRFIIAGGNSGRADSEHSTDQYGQWLRGEYLDVSLVRDEIDFEKTIEIR
jgi:penicillin amidase